MYLPMKHCYFQPGLYLLFILLSCQSPEHERLFTALSHDETNIDFVNVLWESEDLNILTYLYYYNGAGVSACDLNGDQLIDLYFVSNQGADKLYLNIGEMKFRDCSMEAGIVNADGWSSGVSAVDVNSDGRLDLYVSKVSGHAGLKGKNLLWVNQGNDENGIPRFSEQAANYGLDISALSTHSSFFDFDLDGDLDCYLMNHSVYPNRSYGLGEKRLGFDSLVGDRLLENVEGRYLDISNKANIYQGEIGYGLGLSIGDLNWDGYPDIYTGNDFFENDYLYINQQDGTFRDIVHAEPEKLGHTSHYSMGNTITDLNNDGLNDIISLDMLPQNLSTLKTSGVEDPFPTYDRYIKNGYAHQFMQNTLHIQSHGGDFIEQAFMSGVAATEWSWGVLAADFDLDGYKDLYVSNGIKGATNDMDYVSFIAQDHIQRAIDTANAFSHLDFIRKIPIKKVSNYLFRNRGDESFDDVTEDWVGHMPSFSNGCVYADLDNDGDLDIVVNNIDEPAFLLQNSMEKKSANHLTISLKGRRGNTQGIGAKAIAYINGKMLFSENFTSNYYLSSGPPSITFGLGETKVIDSLMIIWPGGEYEKKFDVSANQRLIFDQADAMSKYLHIQPQSASLYSVDPNVSIDFVHREHNSLEFDREPLIPFAKGYEGPCIDIVDFNGDLLEDIFITGAKWQASALFLQSTNGSFERTNSVLLEESSKNEDTDQAFFDADGDGDLDLIVVSGGNEFTNGSPIMPRLYINQNGKLEQTSDRLPEINVNASRVVSLDLDGDGDQDILIGSNAVPQEFGKTAVNYVLENNSNGYFSVYEQYQGVFANLGLIEDMSLCDMDGDGSIDVLVAGHWMPIAILYNRNSGFEKFSLPGTSGWWNALKHSDVDNDGDLDIVAGNWGLNTRLSASTGKPIRLYRYDFDENGDEDAILTYYYGGVETTLSSKTELAKQLPFINKKFLAYSDFANASIEELLGEQNIESAEIKEVTELASCVFINSGDNKFDKIRLPRQVQASSVHAILLEDFNQDGFIDILAGGNTYHISTQLGRLDGSHGEVLINDQSGGFNSSEKNYLSWSGAIRAIEKIRIDSRDYLMVGRNGQTPIFLSRQATDE